jgi:hypothetical protein
LKRTNSYHRGIALYPKNCASGCSRIAVAVEAPSNPPTLASFVSLALVCVSTHAVRSGILFSIRS